MESMLPKRQVVTQRTVVQLCVGRLLVRVVQQEVEVARAWFRQPPGSAAPVAISLPRAEKSLPLQDADDLAGYRPAAHASFLEPVAAGGCIKVALSYTHAPHSA